MTCRSLERTGEGDGGELSFSANVFLTRERREGAVLTLRLYHTAHDQQRNRSVVTFWFGVREYVSSMLWCFWSGLLMRVCHILVFLLCKRITCDQGSGR